MLEREYSYKKLARFALLRIERLHDMHFENDESFKVGSHVMSTCPFEFDFPDFKNSTPQERWDFLFNFRDAINAHWKYLERDKSSEEIFRLAKWMVKDVGGINRNLDSTLRRYVQQAQGGGIQTKNDKLSSYTKVLAAKDRYAYQILDTRVAAALNILQLDFFEDSKYYFDVTNSSNNSVKYFNENYPRKAFQSIGYLNTYKANKVSTYKLYTDLVNEMARIAKQDALKIEAMLFAYSLIMIEDIGEIKEKYAIAVERQE